MSKTIRKNDRPQYPGDDCRNCRFSKRKGKTRGCGNAICRYDDIRADALANGRTNMKRGWNK